MTRGAFFKGALALLGIGTAKAQKFECGNEPGGIKCPKELPKLYMTRSMSWFSPPQAAIDQIPNGTCPVCFTEAPKILYYKPGSAPMVSQTEGGFKEVYERTEWTRCKHCSAAFFQDSEPNPK